MNVNQSQSPSRLIYMSAILEVLKEAGDVLSTQSVYKILRDKKIAVPADLETVQKSGGSRFVKEVRFARNELFNAGLLSNNSNVGEWALSALGRETQLTPDEARRLIAERRHRQQAAAEAVSRQLLEGLRSATTGPIPAEWIRLVRRQPLGPHTTYVMRFGDSDVWKIGFARNVTARLRELNRHIPSEIIPSKWKIFRRLERRDAATAYALEQSLLRELTSRRSVGERVRCTQSEIVSACRNVAKIDMRSRYKKLSGKDRQ